MCLFENKATRRFTRSYRSRFYLHCHSYTIDMMFYWLSTLVIIVYVRIDRNLCTNRVRILENKKAKHRWFACVVVNSKLIGTSHHACYLHVSVWPRINILREFKLFFAPSQLRICQYNYDFQQSDLHCRYELLNNMHLVVCLWY